MPIRRPLALVLALTAAGAMPQRCSGEIPPIQFCGSRPARPVEPPWIPLPESRPLTIVQADSVIQAKVEASAWPRNRYDIFEVDLDGDGVPEQIAQVARLTIMGYYSQCWWGIYGGGKRIQILYWFYPEERAQLAKLARPRAFRDEADSLGFESALPEFSPAVDVVSCGDITGDGAPEVVVWMLGRIASSPTVRTSMAAVILSPGPQGLMQAFRANTLVTSRSVVPGREETLECQATAFRLHNRISRAGGARDLLLEPWLPEPPDSLCMAGWLDERDVPHDPDQWMPVAAMGPDDAIPPDWIISRWVGGKYEGFRFVKDVKLE
jgi:hypothetical protein